jgi:hypothetical protein
MQRYLHSLACYGCIILLCFCRVLFSQSSLSGSLNSSAFNDSGTVYIVEDNITIPFGVTLVLNAGTVLLFEPFTGLLIEGKLLSNGTESAPVVFTSINDTVYSKNTETAAAPFDWNGITVAAESQGTVFNNAQIWYSVYGIKSQTPNVRLSGCRFYLNGQFNFTIKDQIQKAEEGIPFSYPETAASSSPEVKKKEKKSQLKLKTESDVSSAAKEQPPVNWLHIPQVRYGFLGAGAVGIVGGTIFSVLTVKNKQNVESMTPRTINPETGDYYTEGDKEIKDERWLFYRNRAAAIGGYLLGVLGAAGFTVTYLF